MSKSLVLVTVGAQMPFARLIDAVDRWAADRSDVEVFAQIGEQQPPPLHLGHIAMLPPTQLRARILKAEVVVAHAGMGTIITCLELGTPLIIFPREGARLETRNDHQMATADHFGQRPGIWVAHDEEQLHRLLDDRARLRIDTPSAPATSPELLDVIREFVDA